MRIYVIHCSAKKDDSFRDTREKVAPDRLCTSCRIRNFMTACKEKEVAWAIFSDLYGIWYPSVRHEWYEKDHDNVTEEEFQKLVSDFDKKLGGYEEIWFYYNPGRFHSLYQRLLAEIIVRRIYRARYSMHRFGGRRKEEDSSILCTRHQWPGPLFRD